MFNIFKNIRKAAIGIAGLFSTSFGKTLEKKFGYIIDETPTKYDLKIDEEYIKTGIGGFTHRHFDDHAFHLMWQKVKETLPNDTKFEEIKNYFISMSKDLQTPMGIPLHKINDKESYEQLASYLSKNFGVKKSWLLDIQSVNLSEIFSATIGVVALLFGWKKSEKEEFADLASSLVVAGAVGANPILLIVSLVSLAKSYTRNRIKIILRKEHLKAF